MFTRFEAFAALRLTIRFLARYALFIGKQFRTFRRIVASSSSGLNSQTGLYSDGGISVAVEKLAGRRRKAGGSQIADCTPLTFDDRD
jgi:hypothetical protein